MAVVDYTPSGSDAGVASFSGTGGLDLARSWIGDPGWDGITPFPYPAQSITGSATATTAPVEGFGFSAETSSAPAANVGTITAAELRFTYTCASSGAGVNFQITGTVDDPILASGGTVTVDVNSSGTATIDLTAQLTGLTVDTDTYPTLGILASYDFFVGGNHSLSITNVVLRITYGGGDSWWYNPTTHQYEYAASSPGAGWEAVTPGNEPVPHIESILAPQGPIGGSTEVTIVGTGLATGVYGGAVAGPVDIILGADDPENAGDTVRGNIDLVDVTVTNPDTEFDTEVDGFKYYTLLSVFWSIPGLGSTGPSIYPPPAPAGFPSPTPAATPDDKGWWLSLDDNFAGAAYIVSSSVPRNPRTFAEISAFAASSTGMMGGFPGPCGVWKNHLVYAKGGYTVGTEYPPIHLFDGSFDREIAVLPAASGAVPKAVMSILVQGGTIYLSTLDSGSSSADWRGRVFSLSIETGVLSQIGTTFPAGHVPYALAWHLGRLWVGTHRQSSAASGKIYFIRPGIDTDWTDDYTLSSSSAAGCTSLLSYKGLLYIGTTAAAATFAKVLVRGVTDAYTTSLTGTGGTAAANNGFLALTEFGGNLYASFWNPDTPLISTIRKFDNSSWTTVYTGSGTTLVPFVGFPQDEDVLFAIGGGLTYSGALVSTPDGTTWSNRTTFLTQTSPEATGIPAFGVVVR
jgi:hypothetical protein